MATDPRLESVRARLLAHKGTEAGQRVVSEALARKDQYQPQELLAIADALIAFGGFIELVGRNLKVQALQAGARLGMTGPKGPFQQQR